MMRAKIYNGVDGAAKTRRKKNIIVRIKMYNESKQARKKDLQEWQAAAR